MDLFEIQRKYPVNATKIGAFFNYDAFQAHSVEDVRNIENWKEPPLEPVENSIPFILYENDRFYIYFFGYDTTTGYYTTDGENFWLVTCNESFGFEIYNPEEPDAENLIVPPTSDINAFIAVNFDKEAYEEGRIIFRYEELRNFLRERKNLEK